MKNCNLPIKTLSLLFCLSTHWLHAAEDRKFKTLEEFHSIDPKSVQLKELKGKVVPTTDPLHAKVLELNIDFAKPGTYPSVSKLFKAGLIDPKKYSGIRFFVRSNTDTGFAVGISADSFAKDGRPRRYISYQAGKSEWKEVIIPFSSFKSQEFRTFKDGVQKVFKGAEPILEDDYKTFSSIYFIFAIERRGTASESQIQFDGLSLIEN